MGFSRRQCLQGGWLGRAPWRETPGQGWRDAGIWHVSPCTQKRCSQEPQPRWGLEPHCKSKLGGEGLCGQSDAGPSSSTLLSACRGPFKGCISRPKTGHRWDNWGRGEMEAGAKGKSVGFLSAANPWRGKTTHPPSCPRGPCSCYSKAPVKIRTSKQLSRRSLGEDPPPRDFRRCSPPPPRSQKHPREDQLGSQAAAREDSRNRRGARRSQPGHGPAEIGRHEGRREVCRRRRGGGGARLCPASCSSCRPPSRAAGGDRFTSTRSPPLRRRFCRDSAPPPPDEPFQPQPRRRRQGRARARESRAAGQLRSLPRAGPPEAPRGGAPARTEDAGRAQSRAPPRPAPLSSRPDGLARSSPG